MQDRASYFWQTIGKTDTLRLPSPAGSAPDVGGMVSQARPTADPAPADLGLADLERIRAQKAEGLNGYEILQTLPVSEMVAVLQVLQVWAAEKTVNVPGLDGAIRDIEGADDPGRVLACYQGFLRRVCEQWRLWTDELEGEALRQVARRILLE